MFRVLECQPVAGMAAVWHPVFGYRRGTQLPVEDDRSPALKSLRDFGILDLGAALKTAVETGNLIVLGSFEK